MQGKMKTGCMGKGKGREKGMKKGGNKKEWKEEKDKGTSHSKSCKLRAGTTFTVYYKHPDVLSSLHYPV